jgi:DNA-binding MarR family transcriptional regulator
MIAIQVPANVELLREISLRLTRKLRRQAGTGLTMSQMSALSVLARQDFIRVGDLARREAVGKSTVTRLMARFEELGFVHHLPDPDDGRSYLVGLTDSGRTMLDRANTLANEALASQFAQLSDDDRAAIEAALPALSRLARLKV